MFEAIKKLFQDAKVQVVAKVKTFAHSVQARMRRGGPNGGAANGGQGPPNPPPQRKAVTVDILSKPHCAYLRKFAEADRDRQNLGIDSMLDD